MWTWRGSGRSSMRPHRSREATRPASARLRIEGGVGMSETNEGVPEADVGPRAADPPVAPEAAPSLAGSVGAREILWKGLDLNLAASRDVRAAAILIGLLSLAAAGP